MPQTTSYYDQVGLCFSYIVYCRADILVKACSANNGLGSPVLDVKACVTMQQEVRRCDKWLTKVCRERSAAPLDSSTNTVPTLFFPSISQPECDIAAEYCQTVMTSPFFDGQINPYDISKPCTTLNEDLCVSRPFPLPRSSTSAPVSERPGWAVPRGAWVADRSSRPHTVPRDIRHQNISRPTLGSAQARGSSWHRSVPVLQQQGRTSLRRDQGFTRPNVLPFNW